MTAAAGHHIAADSRTTAAVVPGGRHYRPGMSWSLNTSL